MRQTTFLESIIVPARFVMIMWLVFFVEVNFNLDFNFLGIYPRDWTGLWGVLCAPFIHGDILHLISNTFPILFLGTTLFWFYDRIAKTVFLQCYLFTNLLVWIFARPSFHIGASGLVYALAFFLIFLGIFRKDGRSLFITIVITLMYGGIIYGMVPRENGVSWESHLLGAIVGVYFAFHFSRLKRINT